MTSIQDEQRRLWLLRRFGRPGTELWDPSDFLAAHGSAQQSLISVALFTPDLIEIEGEVFLKDLGPGSAHDAAEIAAAIRALRGRPAEERVRYLAGFNWIELAYVFSDRSSSDEELDLLASAVAEAWRAWLKHRYPSRRFEVRVITPEETGSSIGVGFLEV